MDKTNFTDGHDPHVPWLSQVKLNDIALPDKSSQSY